MTTPAIADEQAPPNPFGDEPLPPLKDVKGSDYPAPTEPPAAKKAFLDKLVSQTNSIAFALARQASKNAHYASGRMWLAWSNRSREWAELPREEHEIRVSMNHIRPILRARTARLLSAKVDFQLIPSSNDYEERDRCKVGKNLLQSRWDQQRMSEKLDLALEYAHYAGSAAFKSFWNRNLGPLTPATLRQPEQAIVIGPDDLPVLDETGQPVMQDTGNIIDQPITVESGTGQIIPVEKDEDAFRYRPGDTDTAIRTVGFNVRLNPEASGWTAAEGLRWLVDEDEIPVSAARERFPQFAKQISDTTQVRSTSAAERAHNSVTIRGLNPEIANTSANTTPQNREPTVVLREYWELEGPYFPRGRMIQMVGDVTTYDGDFPDSIFPYDPVFDEPVAGWPYGRPSVNDMIDPSDVINRQWTALVQEQWDAGIGQFVSWQIPGVPTQIGRDPRLVMQIPMSSRVFNRSIKDVFTRLDPPATSPDRWRLIEAAERTLSDVGAYHEVTRGQIPPGLDSGVAIEKLLEQEAGQAQKSVNALEQTIISWARKQMTIAKRRYTSTRWIPVERPDLGVMVEGVEGKTIPDPETVQIVLEHFRPHSDTAFRGEIKELMKDQLIDPMRGLKLLDLGRGVEGAYESSSRHYSKARFENIQIEKGTAEMTEVGQEPILDPETQLPMEGPEGPAMQPVTRVGMPAQVEEQPDQPATGGPLPTVQGSETDPLGGFVPFLLPTEDEHLIHIEVHQEIVLDVSKPWETRQLALAHIMEHRTEIQKLQAIAPEGA